VTSSRRAVAIGILVGAAVVAGCRSDGEPKSGETAVTDDAVGIFAESTDAGGTSPAGVGETDVPMSSGPASVPPVDPPTSSGATVPADADQLVLSDSFEVDSDTWDGGGAWQVDVPGEASATVIDGTGVMETDQRGTYEWVRAVAADSSHLNATVFARVRPVRSDEGTVFVGARGDGEWRDAFPYLPQTGVVLEYGYSAVFEGEIVLIVLDGPEQLRIGPVLGPILADGESADIRFEVVGDVARAKVWRTGDDEPPEWIIEAETASPEGGVVQLAYRDGVARSVAWELLTLHVWP
jgi:hypothetical protein